VGVVEEEDAGIVEDEIEGGAREAFRGRDLERQPVGPRLVVP
jgi:hypothetical protein